MRPTPAALKREDDCFENCKSCGRLMMTTHYQAHLITACPDWDATSVEDIRKMLALCGVHYLLEVKPGYCGYCSARYANAF